MNLIFIFHKYKVKFGLTLFLILTESMLSLMFPLFIGYAIDSAYNNSSYGATLLGVLGMIALVIGVGRRIYDSRFYAKVYENIGAQAISKMANHVPSRKTARLSMIREFVEFLEE